MPKTLIVPSDDRFTTRGEQLSWKAFTWLLTHFDISHQVQALPAAQTRFIRDSAVALHNSKQVVTPVAAEISPLVKRYLDHGYGHHVISGHIDGGNTMLVEQADKRLLFHGAQPMGGYIMGGVDRFTDDVIDRLDQTLNQHVSSELDRVSCHALSLNPSFQKAREICLKTDLSGGNFQFFEVPMEDWDRVPEFMFSELHRDEGWGVLVDGGTAFTEEALKPVQAFCLHYYHLDCIMQYLPNGKVVVLNMEILDAGSQALLIELMGADNVIDLAYEDYINKPVKLNFVCAYSNQEKDHVVFSPQLPLAVRTRLSKLGLKLITPASFLPSANKSDDFDADLSKELLDSNPGIGDIDFSWVIGEGSLHCLTQEIESDNDYSITHIALSQVRYQSHFFKSKSVLGRPPQAQDRLCIRGETILRSQLA